MTKSETKTEYLLIRACTDSEWDGCDFALIHCTDEWLAQFKKRAEAAQMFKDDIDFKSLEYYDSQADFYRVSESGQPELNALLGESGEWTFAETDEAELATLQAPENALNRYALSVFKNGTAYFKAKGKHTDEGFYTANFRYEIFKRK